MSDQKIRLEALDPTESFIVQAPAGSGKTTLLISRFICLLATVKVPEEVLAVTFTRKATAEMRERILKVLDPNSGTKLHQAEAQKMVEKVRKRSDEFGWDLLNQPSRLQILTIDALAASLIRRMPWSSRFGSMPGLISHLDEVYEAAADNSIHSIGSASSEVRQAMKILHSGLDNNSTFLKNLIVNLLRKRDQWLRFLLQDSMQTANRSKMEAHWETLANELVDSVMQMLPESASQVLQRHLLQKTLFKKLETLHGFVELLLTKSGTWRSRITKNDSPAIVREFALPKQDITDMIQDCKCSSQSEALRIKLDTEARSFPKPRYEDGEWEYLQACAIVLMYAVAHLRLEFRKRAEVDFIEIAQQAEMALGSEDDPTDLSLILDYQIRHILVDEFQDTSISQKNLLQSLTSGWEPGDGRTLFLVGDPMQSIYRFRESEVGIYLSVMTQGLGNVRPKPLIIRENFRSNKSLVNWFNDVFRPSFPPKSDVIKSEVSYEACTSSSPDHEHDAVHIWLQPKFYEKSYFPKRSVDFGGSIDRQMLDSREALQIVSDIKSYLSRNPNNPKVGILLKSRSHVSAIIPELKNQGIVYYAPNLFKLDSLPVVQDLLTLTRALLNRADRTSWLAVLRAPWCGMDLNDLLMLCADEGIAVWDALQDKSIVERLSRDGQRRLSRVRSVLNKAYSVFGWCDVRQWVEDTWVLLGGPACVSKNDLENGQLFLDLLEQYSIGTTVKNLNNFETYLSELYALPVGNPDHADVHISTIHAAKGLEYDAVFLPSCDRLPGFGDTPLLIWAEVLVKKNEMLIAPRSQPGEFERSERYSYLKALNEHKDLMELTRLMYVACTRARKELYIYASYSNKNWIKTPSNSVSNKSLLSTIWPGFEATQYKYMKLVRSPVDTKFDSTKKHPSTPPKDRRLVRLPADFKQPAAPPSLILEERDHETPGEEKIDFEWVGTVAIWIGLVVHKWLEIIVKGNFQHWDSVRLRQERPKWKNELMALGLTDDRLDAAVDRVEKALLNVFSDPQGQWLLSNEDKTEAEAEWRLTGRIDGGFRNVILDRTFVDQDDTRWIVDYKTGTTGGNVEEFLDNEVSRYREQLQNYAKIVKEFDSRLIRTGLYFAMFPEWREVSISG